MARPTSETLRLRIMSMAETMTAEQIAQRAMLDPEDVADLIEGIRPRARDWIVRCNRTGRWWRTKTARGAYRRVCLSGLTDWDWWPVKRGAVE